MATADCLLFPPASNVYPVSLAAPSNVESSDDVDPVTPPGTVVADSKNGKRYMYVKFDNGAGNVAAAAGQACYIKTLADWDPPNGKALVTSDVSDSLGGGAPSICVGVFVNVITDGRFGFIQIAGVRANVLTNANAAGDRLIVSTTDGQLNEATAGGDIVEFVGVALEASA